MVGLNGIKPNGQKYWRDNRDRLLRPMDATDLIKMLQNHYEQLQDEEKALLPLKRVFVLFNFDEESSPAKNLHYKNTYFSAPIICSTLNHLFRNTNPCSGKSASGRKRSSQRPGRLCLWQCLCPYRWYKKCRGRSRRSNVDCTTSD